MLPATLPRSCALQPHSPCARRGPPDPAAAEFISRFLALSRTTHLAHLTALNTIASLALRDALQPITQTQWDGLKLYLMDLAGGFGADAYAALAAEQPFIPAGVEAAIQVRPGLGWAEPAGWEAAGMLRGRGGAPAGRHGWNCTVHMAHGTCQPCPTCRHPRPAAPAGRHRQVGRPGCAGPGEDYDLHAASARRAHAAVLHGASGAAAGKRRHDRRHGPCGAAVGRLQRCGEAVFGCGRCGCGCGLLLLLRLPVASAPALRGLCLLAQSRGPPCSPHVPPPAQGGPLPVGPAQGQFPHPPEFCAFVLNNRTDLGVMFPATPAMLADLGLKLDPAVAFAYLEAVAGRFSTPPNA